VAAEEPVTSPDQHKPGPVKAARVGAVLVIVVLLMMLCGVRTNLERIFLFAFAGGIALILLADKLLRKNGLK
jgi:hypothetical protein